jgi:hypothetical protein
MCVCLNVSIQYSLKRNTFFSWTSGISMIWDRTCRPGAIASVPVFMSAMMQCPMISIAFASWQRGVRGEMLWTKEQGRKRTSLKSLYDALRSISVLLSSIPQWMCCLICLISKLEEKRRILSLHINFYDIECCDKNLLTFRFVFRGLRPAHRALAFLSHIWNSDGTETDRSNKYFFGTMLDYAAYIYFNTAIIQENWECL